MAQRTRDLTTGTTRSVMSTVGSDLFKQLDRHMYEARTAAVCWRLCAGGRRRSRLALLQCAGALRRACLQALGTPQQLLCDARGRSRAAWRPSRAGGGRTALPRGACLPDSRRPDCG